MQVWKIVKFYEDKRFKGIKIGTVGVHLGKLFKEGKLGRTFKKRMAYYHPINTEIKTSSKNKPTKFFIISEDIKSIFELDGNMLKCKEIHSRLKEMKGEYKNISVESLRLTLQKMVKKNMIDRHQDSKSGKRNIQYILV